MKLSSLPLSSAALLLFCLCACSAAKPAERTIFAMDTMMDLQVYGQDAERYVQAVAKRINDLDRLLSVTREESEVWSINHAAGRSTIVQEDVGALLAQAKRLGDATGGALDVTLYPVLRTWGFTTGSYQVPSEEQLRDVLPYVNYQEIRLEQDSQNRTLVTIPQGMELDLGALAKGYAGEVCAQLLRDHGVTSALLVLGGNVQTIGSKPDGNAWRILVQDPAGETGDSLGTLTLTDQAAVTSGGYQRYFEEDGVRYWHILDPKTGKPAHSGLTSVTVVGDSGTVCDGLSTALFVLGMDQAVDYWQTHRDFEALFVTEDGTVAVTAGLADIFTFDPTSGYTLKVLEYGT